MVCFQRFPDTKCNTLSIDYNAGQIKENIYKSYKIFLSAFLYSRNSVTYAYKFPEI